MEMIVQWVTKTQFMFLKKCSRPYEFMFINRLLRIVHSENRRSCENEGDLRHADIILSDLGLTPEKTKTVDTLEMR